MAPFMHDLVSLMDWLSDAGTDTEPFAALAQLNLYAVQTRYDDSLEHRTPDWPGLMDVASELLLEVERQLG